MNEIVEVKPLAIPERITRDWIERALDAGEVEHNGKRLFVRPFDATYHEDDWLEPRFGYRGSDNDVYAYSATPADLISDYLKHGLLSNPKSINLSNNRHGQVQTAAEGLYSHTGYNAVFVWRTNVGNLEYAGGMSENYLIPAKRYDGDRNALPHDIKPHLRDATDLRQLPPDDMIGIYMFDQREYKRKVNEKVLG